MRAVGYSSNGGTERSAFVPAVFDEPLGFVPPDLAKSKAKRYSRSR